MRFLASNSRRGRTSRSGRRDVSRGGARPSRVREKGAKDAETQPGHVLVRSRLMMAIEQLIRERGLPQTRAARLFGVTQPRVSDLVRGRIELFSIDTLIEMLWRAGIGLSIRLEPRRRPA